MNCKAMAPSSARPPIRLSHFRIQPQRTRLDAPTVLFVPVLRQRQSLPQRYNVFFPSAFTLAHLALAIAASLALTAGLIRRSAFLPVFGVARVPLTLAHLAFVAAIMAALPAALNRLLRFLGAVPLILAHLARAPAAILARAAADMRRFFGAFAAGEEEISPPATRESIWPCSLSICSLIAIMWWSWLVVKSIRFVMGDW